MSEVLVDEVRRKYAAVAAGGLTGDHAGVRGVAEAFGYTDADLAALPAESHMGLSCGNPTATAHLRPGEVVADLGCGGGVDVLLAARRVGPTGRAIGVDMTPEMIARATAAAAKAGVTNADFRLGRLEALPLADASVDCLISNCVVNLVPDKAAALREMRRVLKPGGRLALSDIALKRELPAELADSVAAYVGCVAGAIPVAEYERLLAAAGFADVRVIDAGADLNAYAQVEGQTGCCGPAMDAGGCCGPSAATPLHADLLDLTRRYDVNEFAASVKVFAVRPADITEAEWVAAGQGCCGVDCCEAAG